LIINIYMSILSCNFHKGVVNMMASCMALLVAFTQAYDIC